MPLTHYVVVRRDLRLGEIVAQVTHAAGESFFQYAQRLDPGELERADVGNTIAVVLGARNEGRLSKLANNLGEAGIAYVAIFEPCEPHNGALMAIGIMPCDREIVRPFVCDFQTLREEHLK